MNRSRRFHLPFYMLSVARIVIIKYKQSLRKWNLTVWRKLYTKSVHILSNWDCQRITEANRFEFDLQVSHFQVMRLCYVFIYCFVGCQLININNYRCRSRKKKIEMERSTQNTQTTTHILMTKINIGSIEMAFEIPFALKDELINEMEILIASTIRQFKHWT